jgi:hypothetical protein
MVLAPFIPIAPIDICGGIYIYPCNGNLLSNVASPFVTKIQIMS